MFYNKCPLKYWDYAVDYYCTIYNDFPRRGETISRNQKFTGKVSDLSYAIPFYAKGYHHQTKDERKLVSEVQPSVIEEYHVDYSDSYLNSIYKWKIHI